jgi:hypothetical protein
VKFEEGCNLKRIEKSTFWNSGLKSIRIPKSVEFLGENCFSKCKSLIEVIFTGELEIGPNAFAQSPVKNVKVPVGVKLHHSFDEDCIIEFVASVSQSSMIFGPNFGKP